MEKKFYKVVTLGCRTNQYESQAWKDQLLKMGWEEAFNKKADLCIVNTCTVTESADQKSVYQINKLIRENPGSEVYITGCLAERARDELSNIKGVTGVVSNLEKEDLLRYALPTEKNLPEFSIENFTAHTRAFVKVQDGCNSYCSYCVIPFVRGRSRSRPLDSVLKEIKDLVAGGFKEIVLTGINIGDYDGGDGSVRLAELVKAADEVEGVERLRISSIDPDEVDDELLDIVIGGKSTCHSMHVVLQSGSTFILDRMRRKYTKEEFFACINRCKEASPDFTFTTDIIVGFPGERECDFQDTIDVVNEVRFAKVHMFPYSRRPKTRASRFTDEVSKEIIKKRKEILLRRAEQVSFDLRQEYIGRRMKVLLESPLEDDPSILTGHTENFLSVQVKGEGYRQNQIVEVLLTENHPDGLRGAVL